VVREVRVHRAKYFTTQTGGEGRGTCFLYFDGSFKGLSVTTGLAEMLSRKLLLVEAAGIKHF
jgi:hypothetical protein